jgi:hypothetical protein
MARSQPRASFDSHFFEQRRCNFFIHETETTPTSAGRLSRPARHKIFMRWRTSGNALVTFDA